MACTAKRSEQISDFASGQLSETEADDLLDHILTCSDCSEEFDLAADLVTSLDRHGDELSRLKEESVMANILARARDVWSSIKNQWAGVPVPVRVLVPAAVVVVFAFIVFYPSGDDGVHYSHLAQFEAPRYIPRSLRGPGVDETVKILFEEGMAAYASGDFSTAIEKLSELTETHAEFGEAFFYLGVSYLVNDQGEDAISVLQKAAHLLAGYPVGEQSHWYLGMAYLKREEGEKALREFQRVVDLNGAYKLNAERIIENIKKVKSGL